MSHNAESEVLAPAGRSHARSSRLRVTLLGVACVAFGLLIWSRLLLVTNYPRTAVATPTANQAQHGTTPATPQPRH